MHETDVQSIGDLCRQLFANDITDALANPPGYVGIGYVRPLCQHCPGDTVLTMPAHEVNFANAT